MCSSVEEGGGGFGCTPPCRMQSNTQLNMWESTLAGEHPVLFFSSHKMFFMTLPVLATHRSKMLKLGGDAWKWII